MLTGMARGGKQACLLHQVAVYRPDPARWSVDLAKRAKKMTARKDPSACPRCGGELLLHPGMTDRAGLFP
jgi:hypothetical protein